MNANQFNQKFADRKVTKQTVYEWLSYNRRDLQLVESNGQKGVCQRDLGPAASFKALGKTWREVLMSLAINEE